MKNIMKKITVVVLLGMSTTALVAGPSGIGHSHGNETTKKQLSKEDILEVSKKHITLLVKSKKVDPSWEQSTHTDIKQQTVSGFKEWMVQYKNTQVQDVAKQTLFIFVDVYGQVLAANHTGK